MSKKEKELYEPVKYALERAFQSIGKHAVCETAATAGFGDQMKAVIPSGSEILFRYMNLRPDIAGIVEPAGITTMLTVEVKLGSPTIKDVYQAKLYKEVFGATLGFLIATGAIPEEMKRLCCLRPTILHSFDHYNFSLFAIGQFDPEARRFVDWLGTHSLDPDPFKHLNMLKF